MSRRRKRMCEPFRLSESLDLQGLTVGEAIREIQRIADLTLPDIGSVCYVEGVETMASLGRCEHQILYRQRGKKNSQAAPFSGFLGAEVRAGCSRT